MIFLVQKVGDIRRGYQMFRKPLVWTRRELQYIVDAVVHDPEYGRSLIETAFYRLQEGAIKFDYWGSGVLDKWDERDKNLRKEENENL